MGRWSRSEVTQYSEYVVLVRWWNQYGQELLRSGDLPVHPRSSEAAHRLLNRSWVRFAVIRDNDGSMAAAAQVTARMRLRGLRGTAEYVLRRPDLKGLGLGKIVMEALHDEARAMGCTSMELTSGFDRPAARKLYEELGYQPKKDSDRMILDPL